MSRSARAGTVLLLLLAYLCATTYPYEMLSNAAVIDDGAFVFQAPGIVAWQGPAAAPETQRLDIRLVATSFDPLQEGPARIFTVSDGHYAANVTIGQAREDLIVRLRRNGSNLLGEPRFVVPGVFGSPTPQRLRVRVARDALLVDVNGERSLEAPLAGSPFALWDSGYTAAIGNEHTWRRAWLGRLDHVQVAIDGAATDLASSPSLSVPGMRELLRQKLVTVSSSVFDLIINLIAMVPFGLVTALALPRYPLAGSVALWLLAAVSVELAQVLIPGRSPALSDIAMNSLGAGLGAWAATRFTQKAGA